MERLVVGATESAAWEKRVDAKKQTDSAMKARVIVQRKDMAGVGGLADLHSIQIRKSLPVWLEITRV